MVRRSIVVAVLATLAGAGCGGDEGLSAEDYRTQANEICTETEERTTAIDPPKSPMELGPFLEEVLQVGNEFQDEFERLDPPEEFENDHEELVVLGQEQVETFESLIDEIEQSDDPASTFTERIPELNDQLEESNEFVDEIGGIEECESEPIPVPGETPA